MNPPRPVKALIPHIVALAEKAGEAVMKIYFHADFATAYKENESPFTRADMASHELVLAHLRTLTPDVPVLSEESKSVLYDVQRAWRIFWQIGPVECISMGSSLKMCLVAEGAAQLYPRLGPTMEWDTAAAQCVVEMAGGAVTDLQGHALMYNKPDLRNPHFMVSGYPAFPWQNYVCRRHI